MVSLQTLLKTMIAQTATDLHLTAGAAPVYRVQKQLIRAKTEILSNEDVRELAHSLLDETQISNLEKNHELSFSFGITGLARFRAHYFQQRSSLACVFRQIPFEIPTLGELGFGESFKTQFTQKQGLVLVTGASGSGKSTTLASMVDTLNQNWYSHILTLEDPIEYVHKHKNSIINQREITVDVPNFSKALRAAFREDPDVIMISELRNREMIEAALDFAETGHLVLTSLPALNIEEAQARIELLLQEGGSAYDSSYRKKQWERLLLMTVGQKLIPALLPNKMCLAFEIKSTTANLNYTLDQSLKHLIDTQKIAAEEAQKYASN